jgi:hypothetical protein
MRAVTGIIAAAVLLASCAKNEERAEQDFAECRLRVAQILPAEISYPSDNFKELLDSCMIAKGYFTEFSATTAPCFNARSEECYALPKKWYRWSN